MTVHLPTCSQAMVRVTGEMKPSANQAFYATLQVQANFASELVDSGTNVSLVSWNFLQSVGFSGALEVYKDKNLTANSNSRSSKRKAELIVQLQAFAPEFWATLLISTVDTIHCLLALDLSTKSDCILYAKARKTLLWQD